MPRLVVPQQRTTRLARKRAERKRDYVVLLLKATTFLVTVGVLGVFVLLAGTDELDSADGPPAATAKTPSELAQAPELRLPVANSATASIVPTITSEPPESSPPPSEETSTEPPAPEPSDPGGSDHFVQQGAPCDDPGDYAFTREYRPVVCFPDGQSASWQYMF